MRTKSEYDNIVLDLHTLSTEAIEDLPDADPAVDFSIRLAAMEIRLEEMRRELKALRPAS
ncbi:MAG: hypothetical protein LBP28_08860 [Coriobacteriales bacterium]|jgi:hypothetical protein|nr:hypothetical protein [Coriobacteriales bacterium]